MKKRTVIRIQLKSDLCVSSGYAFARIIDTDVCMDAHGFPYIPSKRFKGVMRETAELIGYKDSINSLFGKGGNGYSEKNAQFYLEDAHIAGIEEIRKDIACIDKKKTVLTPQNILNLFTTVKAQTKIDESGVADEDTLRYIRTVNQYMPACIDKKQEEVIFEANIEYDSEYETQLEEIVRAVRHIGMDRNRGLGNVRCEMDVKHTKEIKKTSNSIPESSSGKVEIEYTIQNTAPLMLSASKDSITENYISGQMVLGALASLYLKSNGLSEPDETFNELFLQGNTVFTNLYPTDTVQERFYPAPLFINRLKKTKKYVCRIKQYKEDMDSSYNPEDGNQPKKLSGKFIQWNNNKISIIEPKTNIVYHHSKTDPFDAGRKGDDSSSGILYTMETLESGQLFSGSVIVDKKYEEIIIALLNSSTLRFGKSRSAEYGSCKRVEILPKENKISQYSLEENEKVMVVFDSDTIIQGEYGYTTRYEDVLDCISKATGLVKTKADEQDPKVFMSIKTVTGYNAKMNLKKSSIPAIAGGSAFELMAPKTGTYSFDRIGMYQSEGFGQIRLVREKELSYIQKEIKSDGAGNSDDAISLQGIKKAILKDQLLDDLKAKYINNCSSDIKMSSSLVGRITLMLKQSDSLEDFGNRIVSIKRDQERNEIIRKLSNWNVCSITTKKEEDRLVLNQIENKLTNLATDNLYNILTKEEKEGLWKEYLTFILLHIKYSKSVAKKGKKKEGE